MTQDNKNILSMLTVDALKKEEINQEQEQTVQEQTVEVKKELDEKIKKSETNLEENYNGLKKLDSNFQKILAQCNLETPDLKKQIFFLREKKEDSNLMEKMLINEQIKGLRCQLMIRDTEIEGSNGGISVSQKKKEAEIIADDKEVLIDFIGSINTALSIKKKEINDTEIERYLMLYLKNLNEKLKELEADKLKLSHEPITTLQKLLKEDDDKE